MDQTTRCILELKKELAEAIQNEQSSARAYGGLKERLTFCENCLEVQAKAAKTFQTAWHDANAEIGKVEARLSRSESKRAKLREALEEISTTNPKWDEIDINEMAHKALVEDDDK